MPDSFGFFRGLLEGITEGAGRLLVDEVRGKKSDATTQTQEKNTGTKPANPGHAIGKGAGKMFGDAWDKLERKEERRQLYRDLTEMPWDDKKNIIGLLKRKLQSCEENDMVADISVISKEDDKPEDRQRHLKYLNDSLPQCVIDRSEEGEILLALLDDNGKEQLAKRGWYGAKIAGGKIRDEYVPKIKETVNKHLKPAGDATGANIDKLAKWLEKHGGK